LLVKLNEKRKEYIGQIDVKLRLFTGTILKRNGHGLKVINNQLDGILYQSLHPSPIQRLPINIQIPPHHQLQHIQIVSNAQLLNDLKQQTKQLDRLGNVLLLIIEDEIIQEEDGHFGAVKGDH
jgi:hypothetical protein